MLNSLKTRDALLIPTLFALEQIDSTYADSAYKKLKSWYQEAVYKTLNKESSGLALLPESEVTFDDLCHCFAGLQGDKITSRGIALLEALISNNQFPCLAGKPLPKSLVDYRNRDFGYNYENRNTIDFLERKTKLDYENLEAIFTSAYGNTNEDVTLQIGDKTITRICLTHERRTDKTFAPVFVWENEACRTIQLNKPDSSHSAFQ